MKTIELTKSTFSGPLRCDHPWRVREVVAFVGETYPALFLECFAYSAGTTLTMLLTKRVQRGMLVIGDSYLGAFWREALKTDNLIRKATEFKATEANVEGVVGNPDRDPAFWTLVKSQCSWQGRLDRKAFLEWNVTKAWNREGILEALSTVRSLSHRLDIIEGRSVEILEQYADATAFLQFPLTIYDKWDETLCEKWHSEQEQETLFQILASRKGPWMLLRASKRMREWSQTKGVGAAWIVGTKMPYPILVSDRLFAAEQNERSLADEKRLQELMKGYESWMREKRRQVR